MHERGVSVALFVSLALAFLPRPSPGQMLPGRNVNMVSGTTYPGGDPYLQRQNEPSCAVSTRDRRHVVCGANDYRSVDIPGLPDGKVVGDAWLGLFKSFDGGYRWQSTLLPGYPQDLLGDRLRLTNPRLRGGGGPGGALRAQRPLLLQRNRLQP